MKRHRRVWFLILPLTLLLAAVSVLGRPAGGGIPPIPTTLIDFFQPGSQPSGGVIYEPFLSSNGCAQCHEFSVFGVEETVLYPKWQGSMHAQAARDPEFIANFTIANQDADFSGDLCIRCHMPGAWLEGRSSPTDGSALLDSDRDGINCHVCHRMVDPVLSATSPFPDEEILANINPLPISPGGGNFVLDPSDRRRGPFVLDVAPHPWEFSPFHSESAMCGTCHDVSNPVFVRQEDGSYAPGTLNEPHPTGDKRDMFPEQRTYSEWLASEFAATGVDMQGRFGGTGGPVVSTCQDCHMPPTVGKGCVIPGVPLRDNIPSHEFGGANTWVRQAVLNLWGDVPGENLNPAYFQAGQEATNSMLERAATLELTQQVNHIVARVINETGHKLPTGYPEGRRMWVNVEFFDDQMGLIEDRGFYNPITGALDKDNTSVYRTDQGLDEPMAALVGLPVGPSAHLVFNNKIHFDNRIPPRGFTNAGFDAVQAAPIGVQYADGQFWDDTDYRLPLGTHSVDVKVYYQTTHRAFAEFLRDENHTNDAGTVFYNQWELSGGSPPLLMVQASITLDRYADGDFDRDLNVDLFDYSEFFGCMSGPDIPFGDPACTVFDFDEDGDVDISDNAELTRVFGS